MEFASLRPLVVYTPSVVSEVPSAMRPNRKTVARALSLFSFHGSGYGRFNSSLSPFSPFPLSVVSPLDPYFFSSVQSSIYPLCLAFLNSGFKWRSQSLFDNAFLRIVKSRYRTCIFLFYTYKDKIF